MLGRWLMVAGAATVVLGVLAGCSHMNKDSLAAKSGAGVDRVCMKEMVSDHEKDVQAYMQAH